MKYLVSLDLRSRNRRDRAGDRREIDNLLTAMGAERVLESQWVMERSNTTTASIYRTISGWDHFRENSDGLIVSLLSETRSSNGIHRAYTVGNLLPNEII